MEVGGCLTSLYEFTHAHIMCLWRSYQRSGLSIELSSSPGLSTELVPRMSCLLSHIESLSDGHGMCVRSRQGRKRDTSVLCPAPSCGGTPRTTGKWFPTGVVLPTEPDPQQEVIPLPCLGCTSGEEESPKWAELGVWVTQPQVWKTHVINHFFSH